MCVCVRACVRARAYKPVHACTCYLCVVACVRACVVAEVWCVCVCVCPACVRACVPMWWNGAIIQDVYRPVKCGAM